MLFLIFDISSEFGHFRKFNTTTSPLTYSIPSRTALIGMMGAIIGLDRFSYSDVFPKDRASFALQIINPIKKSNIAFNLIDTKKSFFNIDTRTQIEFELVKDPKYRVFLNVRDENLFQSIIERIKTRNHHFTPYLGLSQFTAKLEYVDLVDGLIKHSKNYVDIISAVNLAECHKTDPVEFDYQSKYSSNIIPNVMTKDRIVIEYSEILIELEGKPIKTKPNGYFQLERYGNIKLF